MGRHTQVQQTLQTPLSVQMAATEKSAEHGLDLTQLKVSGESSDEDSNGKISVIVTIVMCSQFVLIVGVITGFTIGRIRAIHHVYRESVKSADFEAGSDSFY